jgi:1,4-dihydroxy-2-naphthoyl-CoA hydrolase
MSFIAKNKVRMHDTDMAGILYFARQFRFVHDTFEDFIESEGLNLYQMFQDEKFIFVIVHVEADYYHSLHVGDALDIQLSVERIGTTSFSLSYKIFRSLDHVLIGTAKTVHVCIDKDSRAKCPIPSQFVQSLNKYLTKE